MTVSKINIKNKKAGFQYLLLEKFTAGIQLTGTEIKSIRNGKANFTDSYCFFKDMEFWVKGLHISEYTYGTYNNHDPVRERKLLLNRRELIKIQKKTKEKGFTVIPIRLFMSDSGYAKVEIAIAKGKTQFDKRETIKKRESTREIERVFKR